MKQNRPPIVVILGHVDHGKTTLLDYIRRSNIAPREAGGITQRIGAFLYTHPDGRKITFIDTPGHAAFSGMRSRGAMAADIAVLIVSSVDGVAPQTKEALGAIQAAKIPFLVAFTKIDLKTTEVDRVRGELENIGVYFEGRGGDIVGLSVSAKTGEGVTELIDMLLLVWDMQAVEVDSAADTKAVVIETSKDKRGLLVSVVVRDGTVNIGDTLYSGTTATKVRGIFDHDGKAIKQVLPGEPGQIIGFDQLPLVGNVLSTNPSEIQAVKADVKAPDENDKKVVIKASNAGSLEAILANIPAGINVVASGVGDVAESDVFFAKAAGATIITFEAKIPSVAAKLAEAEKVKTVEYKIIYELFKGLEDIVAEGTKTVLGKADIVAHFPFDGKKVAGCKLISGVITKKTMLELSRGGKAIGMVRVTSLKKQKSEVVQVSVPGEEFGILFEPQLDFAVGDVLVSH